ncbi:MAG: hypothetical protein ACK5IH_13215 [Betaproteobacteria bacterium]
MAAAKAVWRSSSGGGNRREPAWILGFKPKRTNLHEKYDYPLIRFHGVLAPNAKLRALVVPQGSAQPEQACEAVAASACEAEPIQVRSGRISWARLLKRVFDIDMHTCPNCGGGELKIIAAILERPVIAKILTHLGLDPQPPPRGRAREVVQD